MTSKTWDKFTKYGSGFEIEAERDYQEKGEPLVYHLKMFGIIYPPDYEIVGYNIEKLMKQAMRDGDKEFQRLKLLKKKHVGK